MNKTYFTIFIIILNVIYTLALKENSCKLKMAASKMSVFRQEKLIFNEGVLYEERFGKNAFDPYVISTEDQIEYFYIMENKISNKHSHEKIVFIF
jgi:hypothetical protein